jgi:cytochrome c oxidase subunit 2
VAEYGQTATFPAIGVPIKLWGGSDGAGCPVANGPLFRSQEHGLILCLARASARTGRARRRDEWGRVGLRSVRWRHRRLWWIGVALAALSLTGCAPTPQSALQPVGPVARIQLYLLQESLWIMLGVAAVVLGWVVYVMVRFREGTPGEPSRITGNHKLELVWTIIPFILLGILAVPTVETGFYLEKPPAHTDPLVVKVIGHQYWWTFTYPSLGITTANELHIPTGRPIQFQLVTDDVIHAFWVPPLGGKTDLIPGRTNTMWLEADKPGRYPGQCANFCGVSHANMHFYVVAEPPAQFDAWANELKHPDSQPHSTLAEKGMKLFALYCSSCHTIAGTPFQGHVGPNLTALSLRQTIAAGVLTNTPANLALWIHDPQAVKPGALMPNLHLSWSDVHALAAYLSGLK